MNFLSLTLLLSALLVSQAFAGIAIGFANTTTSAGDKCLACSGSRLFYCTNPTTKVLDCYDNTTDCPVTNQNVTTGNLPPMSWITNFRNCNGTSTGDSS